MSDLPDLRSLQGFILDMDGCLYRGNEAIPGAPEFVAHLRRSHIPFLFVTNNSTTPPEQVARRLTEMGIPTNAGEVLGSAQATAAVLRKEMPGSKVLVVGEEGLRRALEDAGFELTDSRSDADIVVAGLDRTCTYLRLQEAALAIRRGARFVATNDDRSLPTEIGEVPGAGALLAALEAATDRRATVIGKPAPLMFEQALAHLGTERQKTACVGDRPETDILAGQRAGLPTIGLLSGVGTRESFAALPQAPDWIFEDLGEVGKAYFGGE